MFLFRFSRQGGGSGRKTGPLCPAVKSTAMIKEMSAHGGLRCGQHIKYDFQFQQKQEKQFFPRNPPIRCLSVLRRRFPPWVQGSTGKKQEKCLSDGESWDKKFSAPG
jgi:hypothetical protein